MSLLKAFEFLQTSSVFAAIVLIGSQSSALPIAPKPLVYCSVPWFGSNEKDSNSGPDREIAEAFLKSVGRSGQQSIVRWSDLFERTSANEPKLFANGQCAFFAVALTMTEERENIFKMIPIYPGRTMVVVPKKHEKEFANISALSGKSTAVVKLTTYAAWLAKANETETALKKKPIKIKELPSGGAVDLMDKGEIDFVLMDTIQAFYLLLKKPGQYALAFPAGGNEKIGWAFPKAGKAVANQFDEFIKVQRADPKSDLNKIFEKYFGLSVRDFEEVVFTSFGYSK